jgi:hypothetical protein
LNERLPLCEVASVSQHDGVKRHDTLNLEAGHVRFSHTFKCTAPFWGNQIENNVCATGCSGRIAEMTPPALLNSARDTKPDIALLCVVGCLLMANPFFFISRAPFIISRYFQ